MFRPTLPCEALARPGLSFTLCQSAGTELGDKCGVDQLAMTGRPSVMASPGPASARTRRVGALTVRAANFSVFLKFPARRPAPQTSNSGSPPAGPFHRNPRLRHIVRGMNGRSQESAARGFTGVTALRPRHRRGRSLRRSRALNPRFQVQAVEPPIHALQIDRGPLLWSASP
jgi:hypothetical protein